MFQLHLITDTVLQERFSHFELGQLAFAGGAEYVQYRNKAFDRGRDLEELKALSDLAGRMGRCLIINDDVQLALEVGAQGVHLGKEDGSLLEARELLGPEVVIGATVHSREELEAIRRAPIQYIGIGPVYGTRSKQTGLPDLGLEGLAELCRHSPFPVVGIGSIDQDNALPVLQAGAQGLAVLSAFCRAADPKRYVEDFLDILDTQV